MFERILRKITSRKFWAALAGTITGISLALGADVSDVQSIIGTVTATVSCIAYIIAEGCIDTKKLALASKQAGEVAKAIENIIGEDLK